MVKIKIVKFDCKILSLSMRQVAKILKYKRTSYFSLIVRLPNHSGLLNLHWVPRSFRHQVLAAAL